jgi:hypothetical protein
MKLKDFMEFCARRTETRTAESANSGELYYDQRLPIDRMMMRIVDAPARA